MGAIERLLARLADLGAEIEIGWGEIQGEVIRIKPGSAVPRALLETIREHKPGILGVLKCGTQAGPARYALDPEPARPTAAADPAECSW